MNSEFSVFKLGEVAEIFAGGDKPKIFSEDKSDSNSVPIFANAEKKDGLYGYTNTPRIVDSAVTVAARGSNVGFVAVRKEPFFPIVRLLTLIPNRERLDVDYLFYNLKQNRLNGTGSGQPQITIPNISNRSISLPSLLTQQKTAKILSDLDAKIELNNKINTELEAMAKLIYDYWFVQFDFPDENGKPYKSSGGNMVYNEELKREIPEGWEVKEFKELAHLKAGGDKPKELSKTPTDRFKVPIYSNGVTHEGLYGYAEKPKIEGPSFTISARGTIGYSMLRMEPFVPIIRLIAVTPKNQLFLKFLHERIKLLSFDDSGSVQKQLTVPMIASMKLIVPTINLLENYSSLTISGINKIENNKKENQKLAELRDWILPMLMNGQVTVGD